MDIKKRILWLDIAKAIAIISVIIGHTIPAGYLSNFILTFHVPIFFIATGFTIKSISIKDRKEFIKRIIHDIKILIIPYCIAVFLRDIAISIQYGIPIIELLKGLPLKLLWASPLRNIYCIEVGFVWFLPAIFWAKIIFYIIENVFPSNYKNIVFLMCIPISLIISSICPLPQVLDIALIGTFFVFIGRFLRNNINIFDLDNSKNNIILYVSFFVWIFCWIGLNINLNMAYRLYPYGILSIIEAICGSICIFYLSKAIESQRFINNLMVKIGQQTLIILIVHSIEDILLANYWHSTQFPYLISIVRVIFVVSISLIISAIKKLFSKIKTEKPRI